MIAVILLALWLLTGSISFVYFWTKDYDLTYREIPVVILAALTGPLAIVIGLINHGSEKSLIKKRK